MTEAQRSEDVPVAGEEPELSPRPLSHDELRQLEQRAKERLADPAFQRRLRATDRLVQSLIAERRQ